MDDFFPFDSGYNDYKEEAQPFKDNIAFSNINQETMLVVPVFRDAEEERTVPNMFFSGDDSKPIVDSTPRHIVLYKSNVQNVNPDADMCSKAIYGRLNFQVLTNDVPGVKKGHIFPFLEDARKYDSVYGMYKKDSTKSTGVNWLCDNPFDRYMRQNYMPYLGTIPGKLCLSQSSAQALQRRIALMDKGFENLSYMVDGKREPILKNGSAAEFFRYIRDHEQQYMFGRGNERAQ